MRSSTLAAALVCCAMGLSWPGTRLPLLMITRRIWLELPPQVLCILRGAF